MSGSPWPMMSLMTSVAWSRPTVPGRTPRTPLAPHEGASSAGGQTDDGQDAAGAFHLGDPCTDLLGLTERSLQELVAPFAGGAAHFCRLDAGYRCADFTGLLSDAGLDEDDSGGYCRLLPAGSSEDLRDVDPCYRQRRWQGSDGDWFLCG